MPNLSLDLAPFGRWTLRDEAAQRRSATRWASSSMLLSTISLLIGILVAVPSASYASEPREHYSPEFSSCISDAKGIAHAIQECQTKESARLEARLNNAYLAAKKKLSPDRGKELQEVQRQWLRFRTLNCRFYVDSGASSYKIESEACSLALTASRAKELEAVSH